MPDTKPPITDRQVDDIEDRTQAVLDDAHATRRLTAVQRQTLGRVIHEAVPLLRDIAAMDGTVPGYGQPPEVEAIEDDDHPPRTGPGSGRDAWVAFAVDTTGAPASAYGALSRDEIIALLESEGIVQDGGDA